VIVNGVDITQLNEDQLARIRGEQIGFVFQFFHLIPSLTAFENISVPMEIAGRRDASDRARQLIDEVGLAGRAHHYPSQLSGGEQQRVAIARALANDPAIVLADEPTGNLDSSTGTHIMDLLLGVHRSRGTTLVLVTHDAQVAALAEARLALRDGRVVEQSGHWRTRPRRPPRWSGRDFRSSDGRAGGPRVMAAPVVLLCLHCDRCGFDRRAPFHHPKRA
jgi:putative ABC transport system ATP-binding protein